MTRETVVDAIGNAAAFVFGAGIMAVAVYAFIMPDPWNEERGAKQYDAMMEQLEQEEMECEADMLHDVRMYRRPTQEDVDAVHAACDRTSGWR
jgi:hypothetical protein